jgi:RNA polymerase sigma-70 factor (ECF subfamily)
LDSELVRQAKLGDENAYQQIVDLYREAVFRLAYLIIGDAHDAEDIAQETFIRAYGSLNRFDDARPLRPWLLQIAANLARNKQRSVGRYWSAIKRFAGVTPEISDNAVERRAIQHEESDALWQAVRRLTANEQEIIYLRYFLNLSVEETADALDVRPGTVKSRLHRALKQLRQVIERDFPVLSERQLT